MSTESSQIPLGRREDHRLEFKARAILDEPIKVSREVVAMLNADGGEIWIGLRDEDSAAIEIQPIEEPIAAIRRLRDHFVEVIEPSPTHDELRVEPVEQAGHTVLRLSVASPQAERRPYAVTEGSRRSFLIRIGERLRPMSREEVATAFRRSSTEDPLEETRARLGKARIDMLSKAEARLWVHVEPTRDLDLDLQDDLFERLLTDPSASASSRSFFHVLDPYTRPKLSSGRLRSGQDWLVIESRGALDLQIPARQLLLGGTAGSLHPSQLTCYPISVMRVARALYEDRLQAEDVVLAEIALTGAGDLTLRSIPFVHRLPKADPYQFREGTDLLSAKPLVLRAAEIFEEPDRCGLCLAAQVFEGFGLRRTEMYWVDWDDGVVRLDA